MNSFYGGKKGAPFIIVCSYPTVAAMAADFSKGLQNTAVQFDEYVIINTVNKNDPDNGRIYRRGYNLEATEEEPRWTENGDVVTRSTGGGEYVGTIVGPAGHAPRFIFTTMAEVDEQVNEWSEETWDVRKGNGSYGPIDMNIIPGYTGAHPTSTNTPPDFSNNKKFNDNILWNYISIRDKNNSDTTVYMGFKIPYTVFSYTAKSVSPYYNRSNNTANFINNNLIDRQKVSEQHPFYEYWDLKIPKGIKGDSFKKFRLITEPSEYTNISTEGYSGKANDIAGINNISSKPRQVLVYDYYHYDANENGELVSYYLGDFNMISSISLNEEGTFVINYTHDDTSAWNKYLKWVTSVTLNSKTGDFQVIYNNDRELNGIGKQYNTQLEWVDGIKINTDGSYTLHYTTGKTVTSTTTDFNQWGEEGSENTPTNPVKWVTNVLVNNNGSLTIKYNTGPDLITDKKIKWIEGMDIAGNGTLTVTYNEGHGESVFENIITTITDCTLDDNGTLTIRFNNNNTIQNLTKTIKWIDGVKINSGDNQNQKVSIKYNNANNYVDIGSPLNYFTNIAVREEDAMLLVRNSDPARRGNITYNGIEGWTSLSSVRDYSGFQLGKILNYPSASSKEDIIMFLTNDYPKGFEGPEKTKVAVVSLGNTTNYFGFDYNSNPQEWKFIGALYNSMPTNMVAPDDGTINVQNLQKDLVIGGIWFVEEDD